MSDARSIPRQNSGSTVEALERVGQVAFEKLADALLRSVNPEYSAVMHFGVNSKGKTIKSPIDGFAQIPGSGPARFIYVQHTTTDKSPYRISGLMKSPIENQVRRRERGRKAI